jgi:hypothetical protein
MDIDIDTPTSFNPRDHFDIVPASMVQSNTLVKHPCGTYFQNIPVDKITGLAAIPYEPAEELGFFKIDFLHLSILDYFGSKEEIRTLIRTEPNWDLLCIPSVVKKLFQLHKNAELLATAKPRSVQEFADCIALIRPNKRHLLGAYLTNKEKVRSSLYRQGNDDKSAFRRGHAISYALTVVLQLHLIQSGIM